VTLAVDDPEVASVERNTLHIHRLGTVRITASQDGDGINEYLIIEGIKDYPDNRVRIFNRNGTVVYESKGYNNGSILKKKYP